MLSVPASGLSHSLHPDWLMAALVSPPVLLPEAGKKQHLQPWTQTRQETRWLSSADLLFGMRDSLQELSDCRARGPILPPSPGDPLWVFACRAYIQLVPRGASTTILYDSICTSQAADGLIAQHLCCGATLLKSTGGHCSTWLRITELKLDFDVLLQSLT